MVDTKTNRDQAFEMHEMYSSMRAVIRNPVPVKVTFGRRTYYGVKMTLVRQFTSGMMAVQSGRAQVGEEYTEEWIELIGVKPKRLENRAKFVLTHGGKEWYVGGWYDRDEPNYYHPFGKQFSLHVWDVPSGSKIDSYDRVKRPRIPMTIEEMQP